MSEIGFEEVISILVRNVGKLELYEDFKYSFRDANFKLKNLKKGKTDKYLIFTNSSMNGFRKVVIYEMNNRIKSDFSKVLIGGLKLTNFNYFNDDISIIKMSVSGNLDLENTFAFRKYLEKENSAIEA